MKHFLNGIEISPRNRTEIGIVSDFTGNPDILSLTTDSIVLTRESMVILNNHISTIGLFEACPYRVELDFGITIEYFVDLTDQLTIRDNEIEIKIKKRKSKDHFFDDANGTSFELMLEKNVQFDKFDVPYFIIMDNQLETGLMLALSLFVMVEQSISAGKELVESISEVIQAATPSVGLGVVVDTGDVIVAVLKAVARAIYFALLVVAIIKLATKMFLLLFPPQRKMNGVKFKELLSKGCQFLGYSFESTIFDTESGWTIVPVPLVKDRKSIFDYLPDEFNLAFNKGVPSSSDTTSTLGSFIEAVETMFNAVTRVNNGVVRIERRDWWMNQTTNQIIPAMVLQSERSDEYTFNTDEIWKRYYMHYQLDMSDLHCMDSPTYDFHDAELSCEPTNVVNADLVMIKGLNDVSIPFSLGARKSKLNWLELYAKEVFEMIDSVVNFFGGSSNYAQQIGERKNAMKISQQFFSVTKCLYTTNGRQAENYANFVSAMSLWNRFHYINEIQRNDWIVKTNARIRISSLDFVNLLQNNFAEIDGQLCEILNIEWIDETKNAKITYRIRKNYASGKVFTQQLNT